VLPGFLFVRHRFRTCLRRTDAGRAPFDTGKKLYNNREFAAITLDNSGRNPNSGNIRSQKQNTIVLANGLYEFSGAVRTDVLPQGGVPIAKAVSGFQTFCVQGTDAGAGVFTLDSYRPGNRHTPPGGA
jgi:hypothetical protein